jgi:hypothetical protein
MSLKSKQIHLLVPVLVMILFVLTCPVTASVPPENTPEIQNLVTATGIDAIGTVINDNNLAWRLSSEVLDVNLQKAPNFEIVGPGNGDWTLDENTGQFVYVGPGNGDLVIIDPSQAISDVILQYLSNEPPLNPAGEVQMTSYYNENTVAVQGATTYNKDMGIVTSPQLADQFNVKADKIVTFSALDGGRMTSGEELLQDNVGTAISLVAFISDCPFAHDAIGNCTPAFCNIVKSGSDLDTSQASVATGAMVRSVAENAASDGSEFWPPKPRVDGPPVELDYSINLHGVGTDPAVADVSAYLNVHKREAGGECPNGINGEALDLVYNEQSTASGLIQNFQKAVAYQSGVMITL